MKGYKSLCREEERTVDGIIMCGNGRLNDEICSMSMNVDFVVEETWEVEGKVGIGKERN